MGIEEEQWSWVVNTFYIYELSLFLVREIVSVIVMTESRQTEFMYVHMMQRDSGCEFIQTEHVYIHTCDSQGSTHPCSNYL